MQSSAPGRSPRPARARRAPAAFTLLELLIAIAIIGILASLILTVAGSANIKAKNAQVTVDIKDLEKGIAAFKQRFGVEPPSRITLYEDGSHQPARLDSRSAFDGDHPPNLAAIRLHLRRRRGPDRHQRRRLLYRRRRHGHQQRSDRAERGRVPRLLSRRRSGHALRTKPTQSTQYSDRRRRAGGVFDESCGPI